MPSSPGAARRRRAALSGHRRDASPGPAARRLLVARDKRILGVIHLKDIVKPGIRERFAELRRMGIRTVMITGDNPLTAAAIAAEAGVDDFLAEATPERKLELIRREQARGQAGRHVRRRLERRAGPCPGGCRRRHEHRHAGRQGGGQPHRSRLRPDQAHRDRAGGQATADLARLADDLLGRQRRGEVLRHPAGAVRRQPIRRSTCSTSCGSAAPAARSCRPSSSTR